jgi:pimeloyl-ACP methyl ester carboxylesterase
MNNSINGSLSMPRLETTSWKTPDLGGFDSIVGGERVFHFLHGNGFCARTLQPLACQLREQTLGASDLLFTDLPGHGVSPQPRRVQPDWNEMAAQVADSIASRSRGPVVGIGHSMGGVITLLAAARFPELFTRIVLLDPVLFSSEIILFQRMMRKTGLWNRTKLVNSVRRRRCEWPNKQTMIDSLKTKPLYRKWDAQALALFAEYGSRTNDDGSVHLACSPDWEGSIFGSYPRGLWNAVRNLGVPVDIFVASQSYGFISGSVDRACRANGNIRRHDIEGSHCFPMEAPETAARRISVIIAPDNN